MIACENRALFECIRDRCKRTGTGRLLQMAKKNQFKDNVLLYSFTVVLLRALMLEFARVSQAIIDPAFKRKNSPTLSLYQMPGVQPGARIIITGTQTERRMRSATLPITQRLTPDRP